MEDPFRARQMRRFMLALAVPALIMLTAANPASARGLGAAMELEAARANARAGGPTNARDAELLERWGCLSGTRSAFCQAQSHRRYKRRAPRRYRRRSRRRW
jgi:hypothetical protein